MLLLLVGRSIIGAVFDNHGHHLPHHQRLVLSAQRPLCGSLRQLDHSWASAIRKHRRGARGQERGNYFDFAIIAVIAKNSHWLGFSLVRPAADPQIREGLVCATAWIAVSVFSLVLIIIVYSLPESRFECD